MTGVNNLKKIKAGIIGAGFVGTAHIDAMRRLGCVEVVGLAGADFERTKEKAAQLNIPKAYQNYVELIEDDKIDVVHNCTPNNLHFAINTLAIKTGKHIFSEKPLAMDSKQSGKMLELLKQNGSLVHGVNFNYRTYPLVFEIKERIRAGKIGDIRLVHGCYLQDWLMYQNDYNWRIEPEAAGSTRAIGDIGSHWCDLAQTLTGLKIEQVFADLSILIHQRIKTGVGKTFDKTQWEKGQLKNVHTEDWGAVLLKFSNGARGVFYVSQISPGRKNYLDIEIDGSTGSYHWNQENPDLVWAGNRDAPNSMITRDPNQITSHYASLPAGHIEGWNDALKNNIKAFYDFILNHKVIGRHAADFATFQDGHEIMLIIDAIAESSRIGKWIEVKTQKNFDSSPRL